MRRPDPIALQAMALPPGTAGTWARIAVQLERSAARTLLFVALHDDAGDKLDENVFLDGPRAGEAGIGLHEVTWFIPKQAATIRLMAYGLATDEIRAGPLAVVPLSRAAAAWRLLRDAPPGTLGTLLRKAMLRPARFPGALRQALARRAVRALAPRQSYRAWTELFDRWHAEPRDPAAPSISYLVFAGSDRSAALAATLASLRALQNDPPHIVLAAPTHARQPQPGTVQQAVTSLAGDYIAILQAGEVLPAHAGQLAAAQLRALGHPEIAITDSDAVAADGTRHAPEFKPQPNHALMLSGALSRGLWLVRRDTLLAHAPARAEWAEELRLDTWLARHRAGPSPFSARIPYLLAHRRHDSEAAPAETLAGIVRRHLAACGLPLAPEATSPLSFHLTDAGSSERVTVIIPSTLKRPHALRCIRAVADGTDHPGIDLHVVVMQPHPLDATQRDAAEELRRHARATVTWLPAPQFNYATANNAIAARTAGEHILLLNDDVAPIRPDWLRWMCAFLRDPQAGIAGARLLYADGSVQHGGVVMGLGGLCDHAHRHLPRSSAGYLARAVLAQEVSAVTGACLLVRRALYETVGGLDERFASAFNDIDFSLRVGRTGAAVLYVPQAELHHYELQTFTSHYEGERAATQEADVQRMRTRWSAICADDPFYNPNLSLLPDSDFTLAVPPRG